MSNNLDLLNNQMSVGQVKTIRTGDHLDYVEMLFSNELSAQLAPLGDVIQFVVKDSEFRLRSLILSLKELYSQLEDNKNESEE